MTARIFITQDGEEAKETLLMCCSIGYPQTIDVIRHNCTDSLSDSDILEYFEPQEVDVIDWTEKGGEIHQGEDGYKLLVNHVVPTIMLIKRA